MSNKQYDEKLKNQYDSPGKRYATEIMTDLVPSARHVTDNLKEDAGDFSDGFWDLKYELPSGKQIKIETEIKLDFDYWGEQHRHLGFPYVFPTVDIPYRKQKCEADLHMVISDTGQYAFVITRAKLDEHIKENGGKPNLKDTRHKNNEPFYQPHPSKGRFFVKDSNGRWRRWE